MDKKVNKGAIEPPPILDLPGVGLLAVYDGSSERALMMSMESPHIYPGGSQRHARVVLRPDNTAACHGWFP
jgi:hypothetical protein